MSDDSECIHGMECGCSICSGKDVRREETEEVAFAYRAKRRPVSRVRPADRPGQQFGGAEPCRTAGCGFESLVAHNHRKSEHSRPVARWGPTRTAALGALRDEPA